MQVTSSALGRARPQTAGSRFINNSVGVNQRYSQFGGLSQQTSAGSPRVNLEMQSIEEERQQNGIGGESGRFANKARPPSSYISKIQSQATQRQGPLDEERDMAMTQRDQTSQHNLEGASQTLGVSSSQAIFPKKGLSTIQPNQIGSTMGASSRPTTAASTSNVLSSLQQRQAAPESARRMPTAVERAKRREAKIAADNAKKQTVSRAPNFASAARAGRRLQEIATDTSPQRKIFVSKESPHNPSLFTLKRARQRAASNMVVGNTHTIENPYQAGQKFVPPERPRVKGYADHGQPFSNCYKKNRSLSVQFMPSIVAGRGGEAVTDDMFKPTLIPPLNAKKPKEDEEESDCSDNTVVKAYKKQQAFVERLYWHEGQPGRSASRDCYCVWGEARHYKRPKKLRFYSAKRSKKSKEIWARLTRPKSAAVIRARD